MAKCKYCGKDAGIFKSVHPECEKFAKETMHFFTQMAVHACLHGGDEAELRTALSEAAANARLSAEERQKATLDALSQAAAQALEDGIVTPDEEKNLLMVTRILEIPDQTLYASEAWGQLVKSRVLAEVMAGKVPERCNASGLQVVLQKGESVIWMFNKVASYESRTRRHFVGASAGVSVRVAKGVYLRTSAFKGHPVEKTEIVHADTGSLIITNKNIFFQGAIKVVKLPARKLAAIQPYSDGIGLQLDTASATMRLFQNLDGWFAYNVVSNLNLL